MGILPLIIAASKLQTPSPSRSDIALTAVGRFARVASLSAALVGRYEYRDTELVGTVELRADGSFDYHFRYIGPPVKGEKPLDLHLGGVWWVHPGGRITLSEAPPAAEFVETTSSTDPSVGAAITITLAGPHADRRGDLGVLVDDGANGFAELKGDSWSLPLAIRTPPRTLEIMRNDGRSLFRIHLAPGQPNRFAFTYSPGPAPAFSLSAMVEEGDPDVIGVEFGQAGVRMTRVRSE